MQMQFKLGMTRHPNKIASSLPITSQNPSDHPFRHSTKSSLPTFHKIASTLQIIPSDIQQNHMQSTALSWTPATALPFWVSALPFWVSTLLFWVSATPKNFCTAAATTFRFEFLQLRQLFWVSVLPTTVSALPFWVSALPATVLNEEDESSILIDVQHKKGINEMNLKLIRW